MMYRLPVVSVKSFTIHRIWSLHYVFVRWIRAIGTSTLWWSKVRYKHTIV